MRPRMRSIIKSSRLLIVASLLAGTACGRKGDADEAGAAEGARVVTGVQVTAATDAPFALTVDLSGVVIGRSGRLAALSAPAPARIVSVNAVAGQRVAAGTPLVLLDSTAFLAAVHAADAALQAATAAQARAQRLADAGVMARRELEQARSELAAAQGAAETAHRALELSVVRAPFAGVVAQVNALVGSTADPAQPLVQIADAGALDVALAATPEQAVDIHVGTSASITAGAGTAAAQVTAIGAALDSATRSVTVRVALPASSPFLLGQTVTARLVTRTLPHAVLVPLEALVPEGEGFKVFVVGADSVAHARTVVLAGRNAEHAAIATGLTHGERVVGAGAYGLDDSVKVAPAAAATTRAKTATP